MIPGRWHELAEFQLRTAARWKDRGAGTNDVFARFFFYFAGINALYYLWRKIDALPGKTPGKEPNEQMQIRNLLQKAVPGDVTKVLAQANTSITYFRGRPPIERMDRRQGTTAGNPREGRNLRAQLDSEGASDRLCALGAILYLVRSNLVHGSKMDQGDDQDVVEAANPGLEAILAWAIEHSRAELRGKRDA